jgi:hypothetical protein
MTPMNEELHLTEENKAELRSLVSALTADQPTPEHGIPTHGIDMARELDYVLRRAFVKKMVTQIYNTSPLTAQLLANAPLKGRRRKGSP